MSTDKDILIRAMRAAEEAFDKVVEKAELDTSFFILDLTGRTIYDGDDYPQPESIVEFKNYDAILKQSELHLQKKRLDKNG